MAWSFWRARLSRMGFRSGSWPTSSHRGLLVCPTLALAHACTAQKLMFATPPPLLCWSWLGTVGPWAECFRLGSSRWAIKAAAAESILSSQTRFQPHGNACRARSEQGKETLSTPSGPTQVSHPSTHTLGRAASLIRGGPTGTWYGKAVMTRSYARAETHAPSHPRTHAE